MLVVLAVVWVVKAPFYLLIVPFFAMGAALDWASDRLTEADYYAAVLRRRRRWEAIRRAANNNKESTP